MNGRADLQVLYRVESKVFQRLHDTAVQVGIIHALETQFGGVPEVLVDGQFLDEQVVLRHKTYECLGSGLRDAVAVDGEGALLRSEATVEQRHEGGLTGSGATHNSQHFPTMQGEAEVVHAIVTAGEPEVDVAPTEGDGLGSHLVLFVAANDGRVIERVPISAFQYAALQPHLIGARQHGNIVEQHGVVAKIGEQQKTGSGVEQCFQLSVNMFQTVKLDVFCWYVVDVVQIAAIVAGRDVEDAGHLLEDALSLQTVVAAEFHQAQQQQRLFRSTNVAVQC